MKKENWILRAALSSSFFACGATALSAQACGNMPYLHQNKFDPEPIELSHVQGTAADQNGASVAQLCVGLFSAQKHELVRYAQSDAKGAFSTPKACPTANIASSVNSSASVLPTPSSTSTPTPRKKSP